MSLTSRTLILALFIALLGILGQWSEGAVLASAWRLPAGLLILALLYEGVAARSRSLSCHVQAPARAYLGRATAIRYCFESGESRPMQLQFLPTSPSGIKCPAQLIEVEIPPGGSSSSSLSITPTRLGRFAWPSIPLRLRGPLGLAWWSGSGSPAAGIQVVPDILHIGQQRVSSAERGHDARASIGGGSEILNVREYRPGDALRAVDWKATARSSRLIVREYTEDQHLEVIVAVDAGRASALMAGALSRLAHYANLAARFAEHAVQNDDQVGLVVFADQPLVSLPPARGLPAVIRIRQSLETLTSHPGESNPLDAVMHLRRLIRLRSLVVLLTVLDDSDAASQLTQAARLLVPKHVPLIASLISEDAIRLAEAPARNWLDPYVALAAKESLQSTRANVSRLRRLGSEVVLARPSELDRAVFSRYAQLRANHRV